MREFRNISDEFTGAAHTVRDEVESVYKPILNPPPASQNTSSPTVERVVTHRPWDQEPEDLMVPVVPTVSLPEQAAHPTDTKGH